MERRGQIRLLSSTPVPVCDLAKCQVTLTYQDERILVVCATCGLERLWLAPGVQPDDPTRTARL